MPTPAAVDCLIDDWGPWSECNEPCGNGTRIRVRNLTGPLHGGAVCPTSPGAIETEACNPQPCPVDCRIMPWSGYTECSKSCDGGTKQRYRTVVEPQFGGAACPNT